MTSLNQDISQAMSELDKDKSPLDNRLSKFADKISSIQAKPFDWHSKLLPASYKGVEFFVIDRKISGDHRNPQHDYPNKDVGHVETMGRKLESYSITAFVAGDNYLDKRKALLDVLRKTEPGTYVDPYDGEITAVCGPYENAETIAIGMTSAFTFTLTEAGDYQEFKGVPKNGPEPVLDAVSETLQQAIDDLLETIELAGAPARVVSAAIQKVRSEAELIKRKAESQTSAFYDSVKELIKHLGIDAGSDTINADNLKSLQDAALDLPTPAAIQQVARFNNVPYDTVISAISPTEQSIEANTIAQNKFNLTTYLCVAAQNAMDYEFSTAKETTNTRDQLVYKLHRAGHQDLAIKLYNYLTQLAGTLPDSTTIRPTVFTSTLELAQQLYGDATRADEIAERNEIEHHGFIINQSLEVLNA